MHKFDIKLRKTIFSKLLFIFICILLPIYFIGIGIYQWGESTVRNDIKNSMSAQGTYFIKDLEDNLLRVRTLQNNLLINDDMNKLINVYTEIPNDYERSQSILRLVQQILAVKNSSVYIDNILIHIATEKISIDAAGKYEKLFVNDFNYYSKLDESAFYRIIYLNGKPHLVTPFFFYDMENKKNITTHIIDISLSVNDLEKSLIKLKSYDKSGSFLIDHSSSDLVAADSDEKTMNIIKSAFKEAKNSTVKNIETVKIGSENYLILHIYSDYLNTDFYKYVPENDIFKSIKKYKIWLWAYTGVNLIIILIFSMSIKNFIRNPLIRLIQSFKRAEDGDLNFKMSYKYDDEFAYLFRSFNTMTTKISEMIEQVYTQKLLVKQSEYKQLQSQINPHFLYNSFFILQKFIEGENVEKASLFAEHLANYFKYITRNASDEVKLFDEVEHARIYAEIQAMRFSKRIHVEFEQLPQEYINIMVPRLILQPLIENFYKHGLKTVDSGGKLRVNFLKLPSYLCIIVEDNGKEIGSQEVDELREKLANMVGSEEITGIVNINKRIQFKFGKESGIAVRQGEMGGLKVVLKLYIQEENKDV